MAASYNLNSSVVLSDGKKFPIFGLGTWKSKPGQVESAVKKALEIGYRHIDCAHVYGNEKEVGEALRYGLETLKVGILNQNYVIFKSNKHLKKNLIYLVQFQIPREELFITSKLWNTFHQPEDVEPACRTTLANLGLDYLDLYLIHWPTGLKKPEDISNLFPKDENDVLIYDAVDPTETWLAMETLVSKGLCKSIGLSNFNSVQIDDVLKRGTVSSQSNIYIFVQEIVVTYVYFQNFVAYLFISSD